MRKSPLNVVDPGDIASEDREGLERAAESASEAGTIQLASLPEPVRRQLMFAMEAYKRGEAVVTIATTGKPLTSTEAAQALGMSRTHLARLCDENRIASFRVGSARRIPAAEVIRILSERSAATAGAREAVATADERRRARAARRAGLA